MMIAALLVLAIGSFLLKAVGPVASAGRELPPLLQRAGDLLPAALLAALVATQTFADGQALSLDARAVAVGAAAVAVALRAPFALVVIIGAGTAAVVRLAGVA